MKHLLPVLSTLLLAAAAHADIIQPAQPISTLPRVINKAGTYVVTGNLIVKGTSGAGISIRADHVILDLNEHTISNVLPKNEFITHAQGVSVTGANEVQIRNGTLEGFASGIVTNTGSSTGHTLVEGITCTECSDTGINVSGDIVEVRNCRTDHCTNFGIMVTSNFATITGNEVLDTFDNTTTARGIEALISDGSVIRENRVENKLNGDVGISIFSAAGSNFAIGNTISGFTTGLEFANGSPGKYLNNLIQNCATHFSGGTPATGNN